ncbi:ABC transporter substrate-binding protein [Oceanobacillus caeni]|uniref:Glycerol-3-phosphate ABC transporter substrate-binding protein n=1 Tax=Oceanobacillus caeni TaxID=405946 RepID=A0ABR5MI20_9BACI|nr:MULTISPECIES: ABC transporter substrate-binding protein [Bacillaceae]KPH73868.1 glycerol-3-phosphate ABC transporter substrate-binding protein [Oceanobacillus caeni]MBU8791594.1 ABC transporter substrate-binding protein [Oceanobacillus caeni]MCR1835593.1 ABC transporter substrate-binding protein [Oceanobacillus caeni]MED4473744.1 ABC transporter substrate-binding protein [Oceanobacillus caeni]
MKKVSYLLIFIAMMLLLVACGDGEAANSDRDGPIEITYWYAWGDKIGENNENLVKQFNEMQDEIHVTAEFQGNYDELQSKTQAAFAAGNAPEVTQNEISSIETFAKSDMIQDLSKFVEEDAEEINMEDFNPGLMGNSYVDDKLYGLPYLRSTPIVYINKTMFEEKGIDPESIQTWEDFQLVAEKLTDDEHVGISMPVDIWFYEAFVAQAGGEMFDKNGKIAFNGESGVEALNFWKEMVIEGRMRVPGGEPQQAADMARQDFATGRAGMYFSSTADLTLMMQLAEENGYKLETIMFPENEKRSVPTGGANLVMTSGLDEKKQQAAWEFIKFMTAPEQTAYASSYTGYLPSRLSSVESDTMQELYEEKPQFKVAVDQLQYGNARPMIEGYPEVQKILIEEIQRLMLDTSLDAQDVLDQAAERSASLIK